MVDNLSDSKQLKRTLRNLKNKSEYRKSKKPYQEVYTEKQKQFVANLFQKEINLHGYSF